MGTLQVAELNDFTGGINTVTAPYLIAKNEATALVNVDIRRGGLVSASSLLKYQDLSHKYWFQFIGKVYQYDALRSNVIWNNTWYWADGAKTGKKLPNEYDMSLGIDTPTQVPKLTEETTISEGHLTGTLRYCYTFYDSVHGVESAPSPLSAYMTVENSAIKIDNLEAVPTNADSYRLYRIGGYLPYFQLVAEITSDTYIDNLDETEIDGRKLQTIRNGPPPSGINYFTELGGRLYGATGNRLYYSALGNPDSWYVYDYILFKDTIFGIAKTPAGLLVMGNTWTAVLEGNQPNNFRLRMLSEELGCKGHSSIAYIGNYAIWLSGHGIVRSNGFSIELITKNKIEKVSDIDPISAATLNSVYYLAYAPGLYPSNTLYPSDELYPQRVRGTSYIDQGVIQVDFKRGRGFSYHIRDIFDIAYLGIVNGEVMVTWGDADIHAFECDHTGFESCDSFLRCSGYELAYLDKRDIVVDQMLTPSNDLWPSNRLFPTTYINTDVELISKSAPLFYISPILIDGSYNTLKEYDKVRVIFRGIFNVQVLFDNNRVIQERVIVSLGEDMNDCTILGIPNSDNKACSIRFIISGVGVIHSIQYSFKYRELP